MAIKEISRRILTDKLLDSLRQEIEILKSVSNRNIIKLVGVKKSTKNFYLIMEYCNGGDLHRFLKAHKRVEEHVAQSIVYQISCGLHDLARNRIIHRDLKLSNLLISEHGGEVTIKIADFGFARVLSSSEDAQTFCGTAPNMAPEVLTGYPSSAANFFRNKYNEKADLWSLGTIIFQLVAGYPPFEGKNPIQVLESIKKGSYSYPSDTQTSATCKSLIEQLLQANPDLRLGWPDYFDHPFVKTSPNDYLLSLRTSFGDSYGLRNPLTETSRSIHEPIAGKKKLKESLKPFRIGTSKLLPTKDPAAIPIMVRAATDPIISISLRLKINRGIRHRGG